MFEAKDEFESAISDLNDVKSEYEEWKDNLPENLRSSALGEKLDTVCDITTEVEIDLSDAESAVDEAEGADLPMGFGRD